MPFDILEILPHRPLIKVIDVGARSVGPDGDCYATLVQAGLAKIVGFEPVQSECDKLNSTADDGKVYLPYAVGDGRPGTLHVCNHSMTSSLYEPNTALLAKFQNLPDLTRVVQLQEMETHRLDDVNEADDPDFIKLDVQGAEVDVLVGAPRALAQAVVVQTEVEFVQMYKDQPLFADVDQHLRGAGFAFHRFTEISGGVFQPLMVAGDRRGSGQMLWADAVYVKDFMALEKLPPEKLLKLAVILHLVYRTYDLIALVLRAYDAQTASNLADLYIRRLTSRPASA